jgi:hypothetical protein
MIRDCEDTLFQSAEYSPVKDSAYKYIQKFEVKCLAVATALAGIFGCNVFPYGSQPVTIDKRFCDNPAGSKVTLQVPFSQYETLGDALPSNKNAYVIDGGCDISLISAMIHTSPR